MVDRAAAELWTAMSPSECPGLCRDVQFFILLHTSIGHSRRQPGNFSNYRHLVLPFSFGLALSVVTLRQTVNNGDEIV